MSNDQTITTAAELDALLYAVGDCAEAAIVREPLGQPWFITEDPSGRYWADTYPSDQDARIPAKSLALPLIVIFRPDAEPARTLPDPEDGCCCTWYSEDRGGGYHETMQEYDPACPVHSVHVYNPRTGVWEDAEPARTEPTVGAPKVAPKSSTEPNWSKVARAVAALYIAQPTVREAKAEGWDEGYGTGVHDERMAAEADIPEYREPGRVNPYRSEADHGE